MQNNSRHGIVIISYTGAGAQLQQKLGRILVGMVPEEDVYQFGYRKPETDFSDVNSIAVFSKTEEILDQHFDTAELIVFISATGIAVRKIAPYLKSKTTDPAVLCMDEMGRFVIPLISGHLPGYRSRCWPAASGRWCRPAPCRSSSGETQDRRRCRGCPCRSC